MPNAHVSSSNAKRASAINKGTESTFTASIAVHKCPKTIANKIIIIVTNQMIATAQPQLSANIAAKRAAVRTYAFVATFQSSAENRELWPKR